MITNRADIKQNNSNNYYFGANLITLYRKDELRILVNDNEIPKSDFEVFDDLSGFKFKKNVLTNDKITIIIDYVPLQLLPNFVENSRIYADKLQKEIEHIYLNLSQLELSAQLSLDFPNTKSSALIIDKTGKMAVLPLPTDKADYEGKLLIGANEGYVLLDIDLPTGTSLASLLTKDKGTIKTLVEQSIERLKTELEAKIAVNSNKIFALDIRVTKNEKDITTNKINTDKKIADNKTNTDKKIADNKAEIEKQISDNKAEADKKIAENKDSIQQNANAIKKNAEDITTKQPKFDLSKYDTSEQVNDKIKTVDDKFSDYSKTNDIIIELDKKQNNIQAGTNGQISEWQNGALIPTDKIIPEDVTIETLQRKSEFPNYSPEHFIAWDKTSQKLVNAIPPATGTSDVITAQIPAEISSGVISSGFLNDNGNEVYIYNDKAPNVWHFRFVDRTNRLDPVVKNIELKSQISVTVPIDQLNGDTLYIYVQKDSQDNLSLVYDNKPLTSSSLTNKDKIYIGYAETYTDNILTTRTDFTKIERVADQIREISRIVGGKTTAKIIINSDRSLSTKAGTIYHYNAGYNDDGKRDFEYKVEDGKVFEFSIIPSNNQEQVSATIQDVYQNSGAITPIEDGKWSGGICCFLTNGDIAIVPLDKQFTDNDKPIQHSEAIMDEALTTIIPSFIKENGIPVLFFLMKKGADFADDTKFTTIEIGKSYLAKYYPAITNADIGKIAKVGTDEKIEYIDLLIEPKFTGIIKFNNDDTISVYPGNLYMKNADGAGGMIFDVPYTPKPDIEFRDISSNKLIVTQQTIPQIYGSGRPTYGNTVFVFNIVMSVKGQIIFYPSYGTYNATDSSNNDLPTYKTVGPILEKEYRVYPRELSAIFKKSANIGALLFRGSVTNFQDKNTSTFTLFNKDKHALYNYPDYQGIIDTLTENKTDITKNTADITKNTADITKNTADITKNTADIDNLKLVTKKDLVLFANEKSRYPIYPYGHSGPIILGQYRKAKKDIIGGGSIAYKYIGVGFGKRENISSISAEPAEYFYIYYNHHGILTSLKLMIGGTIEVSNNILRTGTLVDKKSYIILSFLFFGANVEGEIISDIKTICLSKYPIDINAGTDTSRDRNNSYNLTQPILLNALASLRNDTDEYNKIIDILNQNLTLFKNDKKINNVEYILFAGGGFYNYNTGEDEMYFLITNFINKITPDHSNYYFDLMVTMEKTINEMITNYHRPFALSIAPKLAVGQGGNNHTITLDPTTYIAIQTEYGIFGIENIVNSSYSATSTPEIIGADSNPSDGVLGGTHRLNLLFIVYEGGIRRDYTKANYKLYYYQYSGITEHVNKNSEKNFLPTYKTLPKIEEAIKKAIKDNNYLDINKTKYLFIGTVSYHTETDVRLINWHNVINSNNFQPYTKIEETMPIPPEPTIEFINEKAKELEAKQAELKVEQDNLKLQIEKLTPKPINKNQDNN